MLILIRNLSAKLKKAVSFRSYTSSHGENNSILQLRMEKLAHSGDPYETKVSRKREVVNLSMPTFDGVECLKWSNWKMRRDVKRRVLTSRFYQYRENMYGLVYCKTLPTVVRDFALQERNSTPRDSSINRTVNRCAITSRPRGKLIRYRISRNLWRELADHGLISGSIRAKWG